MSDLVKLARERHTSGGPGLSTQSHWEGCERVHRECLIQMMADEIERLRAIKAAAQVIIDYSDAGPDHDGDWLHWDEKFEALREALK